jgi:SpoVK/Ycf46/Vps4 family AAA+-type ATPase
MTPKFKNICTSEHYPVVNIYAAIWAMRRALNKSHSSLLFQDADDFMKIVGEHLIWNKTSLEEFLVRSPLTDELKEEIREVGFQETWLQYYDGSAIPSDDDIIIGFKRLARRDKPLVNKILKTSLARLEKQLPHIHNPIMKNTRMLQELLGLSDADCEILNYVGLMMQSEFALVLARRIITRSFDDATHALASILGIDFTAVAESLKSNSLLVEYRLIDVQRNPTDLEEMIKVPVSVQACLSEPHETLDQMMLHFVSPAKPTVLSIDDYPHLETDRLALIKFLNGSRDHHAARVNIMFYGEPGTGKTEFVKVLANAAGFKLYEVACADKDGSPLSRKDRLRSLHISLRFLSEDKNTIILFDEIEDIFPTSDEPFEQNNKRNSINFGKAWMNNLLENNPIPVVWVSNSIDQIDPAYLRRFSYHLECRKPPLKVRHRIAEKYLKTTAVSRDFILQIAQKSNLTPALIESAARVVSMSNVDDSYEAERLLSKVIQQSQTAMGMDNSSDLRVSHTGYHLDYLNVDSRYSIKQISESLKRNPSATMCFYGLPGTGKTALAEYLAGELDRPLLAKRSSDILSKWVGGSEKNIANMFREAEAEGAILFLDEADSLLRNRETASKSWEVSQVNELLQQMERFNGIFICATNLFADLDAAALRRFTFKISFKAMTPQQRERMFVQESLLGDAVLLDDITRRRLHRLDSLVPGDFAVVKRQSRMLGTIPAPDDFLAELEAECKMKANKQSRVIGFTA